ncbi:hypothetical protein ACKWTF_000753 [Chironomus riparius]
MKKKATFFTNSITSQISRLIYSLCLAGTSQYQDVSSILLYSKINIKIDSTFLLALVCRHHLYWYKNHHPSSPATDVTALHSSCFTVSIPLTKHTHIFARRLMELYRIEIVDDSKQKINV